VKKLQLFRIDQGICQFDFNDYYAALGIPITADAVSLRKRYLTIAKILHPDIYGRDPLEKDLATQYLAKLVNPAYHVLNQGLERTAYTAVLKLLAKRLMKKAQRITPQSEVARQLLYFPSDFSYEKAVQEIAEVQYQSLDTILEYSGQISELNLVYILFQEGYRHFTPRSGQAGGSPNKDMTPVAPPPVSPPPPPVAPPPVYPSYNNSSFKPRSEVIYSPPTSGSRGGQTTSQTTGQSPTQVTRQQMSSGLNSSSRVEPTKPKGSVQTYIRLAEDYIEKKQWSLALKELRNAEQLDGNNSKCHALFGVVYMNQKLLGMAKSSFQKALRLNPQEPLAVKNINKIDDSGKKTNDPKSGDKDKKKGFFGWF